MVALDRQQMQRLAVVAATVFHPWRSNFLASVLDRLHCMPHCDGHVTTRELGDSIAVAYKQVGARG